MYHIQISNLGRSPLTALALIGGAIRSSSIINSVSSSPVIEDDDFVGDYYIEEYYHLIIESIE